MPLWDLNMIGPSNWLKENHPELDCRITAASPELAHSSLKGKVSSKAFTDGMSATITCPNIALKANPDNGAANVSELLYGEALTVLLEQDGWAWVQAKRDAYVGFIPTAAYIGKTITPSHMVSVPLTHIYASADMKQPALMPLPMGSKLQIIGNQEKGFVEIFYPAFGDTGRGWVFEKHLSALHDQADDPVRVAETLLSTPYLWGGRTIAGIDCSGLVQLAMAQCGIDIPRDTDMQLAFFEHDVPTNETLKRGDIIFFPGHVALMVDEKNIIHANGYAMQVMIEPLVDQVERLKKKYDEPITGRKRIS